jgi:hypothetical protein
MTSSARRAGRRSGFDQTPEETQWSRARRAGRRSGVDQTPEERV